jgi:hypothetical protein
MPARTREGARPVTAPGASVRRNHEHGDGALGAPSSATPSRANRTRAPERRHSYRGLVVVAMLACGAVVATNLLWLRVGHLRTSVIDANWEFSWSHDLDTALLAIGVYASLVGARANGPYRRLWSASAAILALFVLDEVSAFHGQFGNLEKLLYAPILAALVVCVWRLTAGTKERAPVMWSLVTLVFAFAMHVAGLHLLRPIGYTTYVYQVGVGFKEGTELAGLILLVAALWRRAHARPAGGRAS